MRRVEIDWTTVTSAEELWRDVVEKSGHPRWHGRNLDALRDGWVTGGLDEFGPPYEFVFLNCDQVPDHLLELSRSVMGTAADSVRENGGTIRHG